MSLYGEKDWSSYYNAQYKATKGRITDIDGNYTISLTTQQGEVLQAFCAREVGLWKFYPPRLASRREEEGPPPFVNTDLDRVRSEMVWYALRLEWEVARLAAAPTSDQGSVPSEPTPG